MTIQIKQRLIIWHGQKHDDWTTTEILLRPRESVSDWIRDHHARGGFWSDADKFVPWHRINFIEREEL